MGRGEAGPREAGEGHGEVDRPCVVDDVGDGGEEFRAGGWVEAEVGRAEVGWEGLEFGEVGDGAFEDVGGFEACEDAGMCGGGVLGTDEAVDLLYGGSLKETRQDVTPKKSSCAGKKLWLLTKVLVEVVWIKNLQQPLSQYHAASLHLCSEGTSNISPPILLRLLPFLQPHFLPDSLGTW